MYRIATRQIQQATRIKIERTLPIPGLLLAQIGQVVEPGDGVGQITRPGRSVIINLATMLGIPVKKLTETTFTEIILKKEGDTVEAGEVIAQLNNKISVFKKTCKSPVSGHITSITGHWLLIETETKIEKLSALIHGTVTATNHPWSVTIETQGTYIEAICGLGGEGYGPLKLQSDDPTANMDPTQFTVSDRQTVFMAGGSIDIPTIRKAEEMNVAGLICGCADASILTIAPPPKIPIIITEGFGNIPMNTKTYQILQQRVDDEITIQKGQPTSHPLFTNRPILIFSTLPSSETHILEPPTSYVRKNSLVRTLRNPNRLAIGKIVDIPNTPQAFEANISHEGAIVQFEDGEGLQFVPWLNLEHLG